MCLAIPVKIVSIHGTTARAAMAGVSRSIDIRLVPAVKRGDYVLVHAGFAIEKIDPKEAKKTLRTIKSISPTDEVY
jgi:hydrogenase expression/formation protein HypC